MNEHATVLDVYEEALGQTPSEIVESRRVLGSAELASVIGLRSETGAIRGDGKVGNQIWPLISHHTHGGRALFGGGQQDILPRTLTLLLVHDGLVVADPLETVLQVLTQRTEADAVVAFRRATSEIAEVEALIAGGALRLTALRPSLRDTYRAAALHGFGLEPNLRVFTDFLEAAADVANFPGLFEQQFAPQVEELYRLFGLMISAPKDLRTAERQVRSLAAGVIEVSWQFSVAAIDPSCDLAFRSGLEYHLAQALVSQGLEGDLGPGRHLSSLELGRVPNIDPSRLSLSDVLAIRQEDAFEAFRHSVRSSIDQLEVARRSGAAEWVGKGAFEEAMHEQARRLRETSRRATFRDRVKDASVPIALGTVAEIVAAPVGPGAAGAAFAAVSAVTVIWQWLLGRRDKGDQKLCQRYLSMLGGVGT